MGSWRDSYRAPASTSKRETPRAADFALTLAAGRVDRYMLGVSEREPTVADYLEGEFGVLPPMGPS